MSTAIKVLIGPNHLNLERAIPELQDAHPGATVAHCADQAALSQAIADADVYLGWLDGEVFQAAERLQWVQSPSSGVNHFLAVPGFAESPVLLTSASGTHAACLAESALGMILAITRGIREGIWAQQEHSWAKGRPARPKMVELTGSTMGIVGLGAVGRALAKRAAAFGMRVIAVDLYPVNRPDEVSALWGVEGLDDLLRESDYVVITVPWTPQSEGMIGEAQIALMKPTAMLVGISRGGIIDQDALATALRSGALKAAALDVTRPEPLPEDSELWEIENLLITPHIAGGTQFEGQHVLDIFCENLGRYVRDDLPLRNQVDKALGF